jgi:protein Mpv17
MSRQTSAFTSMTPPVSPRTTTGTTPTIAQKMSLVEVSEFYQTYPMQAAVLTCGVKASLADFIAQLKSSSENFELRRNFAYVIYGGIFVGLMAHLEYDHLFPLMFGPGRGHVVEKVIFDDFVSAPLMWLPPAYLIKAMVYDYSLEEGLQKYWNDIQNNSLLQRYWTVWVPAQSISFSVVPDHLRVAWMASISFFWFIMFSTLASKTDEENAVAAEE